MVTMSNFSRPLALCFCIALCTVVAHAAHLTDWTRDEGSVAEDHVSNLGNYSVRAPHPRWSETNFPETIATFPTLPASFNPDKSGSSSLPPPQYIRKIAPRGFSWVKQFDFSSEFNRVSPTQNVPPGQLSRWTSNNRWKGNFPGVFDPRNIWHDGSARVLRVRRHNNPTPADIFASAHGPKTSNPTKSRLNMGKKFYSTAFMKSVKTIKYGYFEIVCKMGDSTLSSAFWLKEHGGLSREIDVFEYSTSTNRKVWNKYAFKKSFLMNIHTEKSKYSKPRPVETPKDLSKERFIKAGLQWGPRRIRWYLNDKLMRDVDHGGVFNAPMNVQISRAFNHWFGEPKGSDSLAPFKIFYVRTWQMKKN